MTRKKCTRGLRLCILAFTPNYVASEQVLRKPNQKIVFVPAGYRSAWKATLLTLKMIKQPYTRIVIKVVKPFCILIQKLITVLNLYFYNNLMYKI